MEIKNNKPVEGGEPRRFSAGRAAAKPGGNSFAAALKKAASGAEPASPSAPGLADAALASPEATQPSDKALAPQAGTSPADETDGKLSSAEEKASAPAADSDAAFADHMDLVRFRLKTGYYASKAINDALTDKLSGYFDELA